MQAEYGDWKIVRELGHGSYGHVYEIENIDELGVTSRAALKIIEVPQQKSEVDALRATGMKNQEITNYFYTVATEAAQEITLMSRMQGISNVVNYQSHMVKKHADGIGWDIYIQMELLTPLTRYFASHAITYEQILQMGIDLCRALECFEAEGLIHRDIKLDNIFVSERGDFKLGDFGIARIEDRQGGDMTRIGTYSYMAPEVYYGRNYDARADQYSLGIVLYQLLNNNLLPFMTGPGDKQRANQRRMNGEELPAPQCSQGRYAQLVQVVKKACQFDPQNRYSSPSEMRWALEAIRDGQDSTPNPSPPPHQGRKIIILVLALLAVGAMALWLYVGLGFFQGSQNPTSGLTYQLKDGTLTVSGNGAMDDYTQSQSAPWQGKSTEIITVIVESGVTSVGDYAFANCGSLTSVELANTVLSVGDSAFASCGSLEEVVLSENLTEIGESAFGICVSLDEIQLPETLEKIGDAAFYGCSALQSVYLPAKVAAIGDAAFWGCDEMEEIVVAQENQTYSSLDGVLMNREQTRLLLYPSGKSKKVYTVPQGVTAIGSYAFSHCSSMNITISEGVTSIGERAFYACQDLRRLELPESIMEIGTKAFQQCDLDELVFKGTAPLLQSDVFLDSTILSAVYDSEQEGWTDAVLQQYGGTVSWHAAE